MSGAAALLLALAGPSLLAPVKARPLILVHVMPWFEAPPVSRDYGWHWTMNKARPPRELASRFRPSIGAYDSLDPKVVECQVQLMKLAGIDGVLADWYGTDDVWDYAEVHKRTELLFDTAEKAGLKIGAVWEDQTIGSRIRAGLMKQEDGPAAAARDIAYAASRWAKRPGWLRLAGRPLLLVFGPQWLQDSQWPEAVKSFTLLTLHHRRGPAAGAFDWPYPDKGLAQIDAFERESRGPGPWMAAAYPRFADWYEKAGQGRGFKEIPDEGGSVFRNTLSRGLRSGAPAVQIATWNDWGEGTQIEPSVEFGTRDLAAAQEIRKALVDPKFAWTARDLQLPLQLLAKRRARPSAKLDRASLLLLKGKTKEAGAIIRAAP